jgi:large subunit ribosomal protein L6
MSRIGKMPIPLPESVQTGLEDGRLRVKGPKGELFLNVHPEMALEVEESELRVTRPSDSGKHRALHGLTRALIANMVTGVTDGFERTLEIVGIGYRAEKTADGLTLALGYSHPIHFTAPAGVELEVPSPTVVVVKGPDKQAVGQAASEIRGFRPPEPYKGKGVRYKGERVRRKAGKTAGA